MSGEIPAYAIRVKVGGGAQMAFASPKCDPHVIWNLVHGWNQNAVESGRLAAAEIIESYDYILSPSIPLKEAIRRLRLMRNARADLFKKVTP